MDYQPVTDVTTISMSTMGIVSASVSFSAVHCTAEMQTTVDLG
jgi:hypothetical protein